MEQTLMKTRWTRALALVAAALAVNAFAQKPDAAGGIAVTSEPGKATAVRALVITAQVVGIDKATRTLTLKGPQSGVVDIAAGDEVKNFDQIKLGDFVVARYAQALDARAAQDQGQGRRADRTRGRRASEAGRGAIGCRRA